MPRQLPFNEGGPAQVAVEASDDTQAERVDSYLVQVKATHPDLSEKAARGFAALWAIHEEENLKTYGFREDTF